MTKQLTTCKGKGIYHNNKKMKTQDKKKSCQTFSPVLLTKFWPHGRYLYFVKHNLGVYEKPISSTNLHFNSLEIFMGCFRYLSKLLPLGKKMLKLQKKSGTINVFSVSHTLQPSKKLPFWPLLLAKILGNLQMFPVPTTHPIQDKARPILVWKVPPSCCAPSLSLTYR